MQSFEYIDNTGAKQSVQAYDSNSAMSSAPGIVIVTEYFN